METIAAAAAAAAAFCGERHERGTDKTSCLLLPVDQQTHSMPLPCAISILNQTNTQANA